MLLYIHIPFCLKKCDYCDFLSFPCDDKKLRNDYIRALMMQLDYYSENSSKFKHISSIFTGGGTPSSLSEDELEKLLSGVYEIVAEAGNDFNDIEYTIECNPGTLTADKLEIMRKYGVNRISLGLQSADDKELKLLGRIHTFSEFKDSFKLAREAGFTNINVDLMSALPGQTLESWKKTLEEVVALEPEHISAYSLIIEEGTPFYDIYGDVNSCDNSESQDAFDSDFLNNVSDYLKEKNASKNADEIVTRELPNEDTEREMYYFTNRYLAEQGYNHYEVSNYAKPGFECKHNCGYWTREDYAGVGLGAASLMNDIRYNELEDLEEYLNGYLKSEPGLYAGHIEHLKTADCMGEFMFLGLRMMKGISAAEFKDKFNKDLFEVYGKAINSSVEEGLLEISDDGDNIRLTERGIDVSNMVFAKFI